jgi:hypothetical protein
MRMSEGVTRFCVKNEALQSKAWDLIRIYWPPAQQFLNDPIEFLSV